MLKFAELPAKTARGQPHEVQNATIARVSISIADHGILTPWLHLEFAGGGVGFGGFHCGWAEWQKNRERLKMPGERIGWDYAADFLVHGCLVGGVERWEDLAGRPVRVLGEGWGGRAIAVGHFLKDLWFAPSVEWDAGRVKGKGEQ